jgi:hypothetical protein
MEFSFSFKIKAREGGREREVELLNRLPLRPGFLWLAPNLAAVS